MLVCSEALQLAGYKQIVSKVCACVGACALRTFSHPFLAQARFGELLGRYGTSMFSCPLDFFLTLIKTKDFFFRLSSVLWVIHDRLFLLSFCFENRPRLISSAFEIPQCRLFLHGRHVCMGVLCILLRPCHIRELQEWGARYVGPRAVLPGLGLCPASLCVAVTGVHSPPDIMAALL